MQPNDHEETETSVAEKWTTASTHEIQSQVWEVFVCAAETNVLGQSLGLSAQLSEVCFKSLDVVYDAGAPGDNKNALKAA